MLKGITDKVRRSFSQAADRYDVLTSLHKEIGRELVKKIVRLDAQKILDIGCGTGYVANKAKFFFPFSTVVGIDFSESMIAKAKELHEGIDIQWLCQDAHALDIKDKEADLILSNLAYQWFADLPRAFADAHRVLKDKGVMNVTLFGERTCTELFASIKAVLPDAPLGQLRTEQEIQEALIIAGFKSAQVETELIKVEFADVMELLTWLKAIGANQLSNQPVTFSRNKLASIQQHYRGHFPYHDGICASFEVIWVYAQKE